MTEAKIEERKVVMVYVGLCERDQGKKRYRWQEIDSAESTVDMSDLNRTAIFSKQIQKGATPGTVWSIPSTEPGSFGVNRGTFLGRYVDPAQTIEWETANRALRTEFDIRSKAQQECRHSLSL